MDEKSEYLQTQFDETKQELEKKRKELNVRQRSDEDQEKELDSLRREIDMRDVAINLHDQKMRVIKDDNTKIRMQLRGPGNLKGGPA